jgi:hypothetical protein
MEFEQLNFVEADRLVLCACRDAGGEFQVEVCREGVDDDCGRALHAHARTMVERGFLERLLVSGTKSKMQGSALRVTFRARPVALALLELLERAEAAEAKLAGRERRRTRAA